jgi:PBP1b-binding outer membrane lipoprotein LpoB
MKKIIFLSLFLAIFLTSCGKEIAPEKIYEVKATKVEVSSESIIQSYTSTVESKESITILSEIPGKILSITKKE